MSRRITLYLSLWVGLVGVARGAELHVAVDGDDRNPGTPALPVRTIQHAADLARPGDTVTVHRGVYRERVSPPRGGDSDAARIVYRAAPGEAVTLTGAELVTGWVRVNADVWKATLPNAFFGDYNPFADRIRGDWFADLGRDHHTGAVYLDGDWLAEAAKLEDVLAPVGTVPLRPPTANVVNLAWLRPLRGPGKPGTIPAASFAAKGGMKIAPCSEGGQCLGSTHDGDWVRYDRSDLRPDTRKIEFRVAVLGDGGRIEVHQSTADGPLLGTCEVSETGGWQAWQSVTADVRPTGAGGAVCLVVRASGPTMPLWFGQVDEHRTTIWAQFKGVDPNAHRVEVNVRPTVFYPRTEGVNYVTVRGFTLEQAATNWAPPTAEQVGAIGTHWSRGWVIERNRVLYSRCSGISLGKYGEAGVHHDGSAKGYVGTVTRALAHGWNGSTVGHHLVRDNEVAHCEQAGIVGSLGCAFSTVTGNDVHDIHVLRQFGGAEMAGIKFHGAVDVRIAHNHVHHCIRGIWLDWMAQGTRLSGNLLDGNTLDLFVEVNHGPFVVDDNLFLSDAAVQSRSQGGAYVHNLFAGGFSVVAYDGRQTPYLRPHATDVAGLHDNPHGDDRYYDNLFVARPDLTAYDDAQLPAPMAGNVFLDGARPSRREADPVVDDAFNPAVILLRRSGGYYLTLRYDPAADAAAARPAVTTEQLGRAAISGAAFENPDGTPLRVESDYLGQPWDPTRPAAGPFARPTIPGTTTVRVW